MRRLAVLGFLLFLSGLVLGGFDGANAPGGQGVKGAPMAAQDGGLGVGSGKPAGVGASLGASASPSPGVPGQGGQGGQGKGKGDGSGPWGAKGAMGGQRGGAKGR